MVSNGTKRLGYGLGIKILVFVIPLVSLVALSLVTYFILKTSLLLTQNERKRVVTMARNLAYNSELGVATANSGFLWLPIESVFRDPVVESAAVYDAGGDLIAGMPERGVSARLAEELLGRLGDDVRGYLDEPFPVGRQTYRRILVPVLLHAAGGSPEEEPITEKTFLGPSAAEAEWDPAESTTGPGDDVIGYAKVAYSLDVIRAQRRDFLLSGVAISGAILLGGVVLTLIFARRITRPLKVLTRAVQDVGKGNLACSIEIGSQDELGTLSEEFNRMTGKLADAKGKLEDYQRTLEEKVRRRTGELQRAYEELKELDRMKDSFLSSVSHELRTPLTSIRSFSEIMLTYPEEDTATNREFMMIINSESERLTRLINDVLDLAKIDAGKMQWNVEELEPATAVRQAVQSMSSLAREKSLDLEVRVEEDLPPLSADGDRVHQVLTNLLSNAIKFTPPGNRVRIEAVRVQRKRTGDRCDFVRISVHDTGVGIAEEELARIFERFKQCGDTLTDKPKGTGLGLAICREIVSYHGGRIWADSKLGEGSSFHVLLPIGPAVHVAGQGDDPERPAAPGLLRKPARKQVLVVENEMPTRNLLVAELSRVGYRVVEAATDREAVEIVRRAAPDLIILDIYQPGEDGSEALTSLRAALDGQDVPILVVSVVGEKCKGMVVGANDYLAKPIRQEDLLEKVSSLIGAGDRCVLVADDDPSIAAAIGYALGQQGFTVCTACDGLDTLNQIEQHRPNLIVLDLMMPKLDGYEVLKVMRNHDAWRDIPVLVLTALDMDTARVKAFKLGADAFFEKSGGLDRLFRQIGKFFEEDLENDEDAAGSVEPPEPPTRFG